MAEAQKLSQVRRSSIVVWLGQSQGNHYVGQTQPFWSSGDVGHELTSWPQAALLVSNVWASCDLMRNRSRKGCSCGLAPKWKPKTSTCCLIGKGASSSGKRAATCAARTQNSFGMVSTKSGNRCQLFPIVKGIFEGIHVTADRCSIIQIEGATNSRKNPSASPCRTRQHQGQGDGWPGLTLH